MPPSPFAFVRFMRGNRLCRSNVVEREIAEDIAAHFRSLGFRFVEVVAA